MKRAELKVGDHLLYARPSAWDNCYSTGVQRVVVVSTAPHARARWSGNDPIEVKAGNGVLVQPVNPDGSVSNAYTAVVQLSHLRGPYEATAAEFEERRKAKHAAANAQQDRQRAAQDRANEVVTRARVRGLHTVQSSTSWYVEGAERAEVSIAADELAGLLDRLDKLERERMASALEHPMPPRSTQ